MENATEALKKHYRVALRFDPDGYWVAEHPELPGCIADGESAQGALASLDISRDLWIESRRASGLPVPEPGPSAQHDPQYSGRLLLRIARSLHRELAQEAEAEGVSLNNWIARILAGRNARKEPGSSESLRVA